ncbi:MAG: FAD-binding oxidoreductase [Candidatus Dormibacteria bacterium]
MRTRKIWGWGCEGEGLSEAEIAGLAELVGARLGTGPLSAVDPPALNDLELRAPRVMPPQPLAEIFDSSPRVRAAHTLGKCFNDLARGLRREYLHPPDTVALPADEADIERVLQWCVEANVAAIPYGGGSSVTGGIEPDVGDTYAGVVSIDLSRLNRVLEVDHSSRAARIQAGILGPALEDHLRPLGLTLRHFPQSFEYSSLGGWIATRSGGHYATQMTHLEDQVEGLRMITPTGTMATRRLPGDGAGPSADRLVAGSEGILGIITEAWMRLQDRPLFRATISAMFVQFEDACAAARAVAQSGLAPANCRLLDHNEALVGGASDGSRAVLIVSFESADHELDALMDRAVELCRDHGGEVAGMAPWTRVEKRQAGEGAAAAWRSTFLRGGHLHDALVRLGLVNDTFETAVTWDAFPALHARVLEATTTALREVCGGGFVSCRFAYVYPDGPAPYYTVVAPGRPGAQVKQWAEIKAAASEALIEGGGTITHHHAVGRYHRPWYDRQRPVLFARALAAAKTALDPGWIMNPGVLVDRDQRRHQPGREGGGGGGPV